MEYSLIEQPQGFEADNQKTHICRLKKALYGLKQYLEHGMEELVVS